MPESADFIYKVEFNKQQIMNNIPLIAYLTVSAVMFFAGIYGFLSRRNMLTILMSLELMLNAADLNFAVFNKYKK